MPKSWGETTRGAGGGQSDYLSGLDKDQMIEAGTEVIITNIVWDPKGYDGKTPRWLLTIEPYDQDANWPVGLMPMPSNPLRDAQMSQASDNLEPGDYIGPVRLARQKNYMVIEDATLPRPKPVEAAPEQPAPRVQRIDRSGARSAPVPEQETPAPRVEPPQGRQDPNLPAPGTAQLPLPQAEAPARRRGRPTNAERAARAAVNGSGDANAAVPPQGFQVRLGTAHCEGCGQDVTGDVFPAEDGGWAMLHKCPTGMTIPLMKVSLVDE